MNKSISIDGVNYKIPDPVYRLIETISKEKDYYKMLIDAMEDDKSGIKPMGKAWVQRQITTNYLRWQ